MDSVENVCETEHHEEGAEDTDKGGVVGGLVGENNKTNDGTDHAAGDPKEAGGHVVFEADKADKNRGDTAYDGIAGEEGDVQNVSLAAGDDHGGTDAGLEESDTERDTPTVLAACAMDDIEDFDNGEAK